MSKNHDRLVRDGALLVEATASLRRVLQQYGKTTERLVALVQKGEQMVDAIDAVHGAVVRPEVTQALDEFETARRNVRVAMLALGLEQGASMSEIGRALGISRQLASRLAAEAHGGRGTSPRAR